MVPADSQLRLLSELAGDGTALELGVGTGRVALPLAARGVDVQGLDASPSMLARLRDKPGGEDLTVTIGDMADPGVTGPFRLIYVVAAISVHPIRLRYAWPAEMDLMALMAGLRLKERLGGWGRERFTAASTGHVSIYGASAVS
ncbi:MAG: class I SAM-dependent methyltransferase [Actinomycetota bacterium]|nr:class I SAM-dependent methyltransferase [Actinomycetota bacterium]